MIQLEGSPLEPGTVSQLLLSKQTSVCFVALLCQLFFFKFHQVSTTVLICFLYLFQNSLHAQSGLVLCMFCTLSQKKSATRGSN